MKWVTREHVHVDRVACPWLVKKYVDPEAEFLFVHPDRVKEVAESENAIPFDAPNVELGHHDGKCTFEVIIEKYGIADPALADLAEIVHSADVRKDMDLRPEAAGLEAIAAGTMYIVKDDYEAIEKGAYVYDALYAHCKVNLIREKNRKRLERMSRSEQFEFLRSKMS